MFLQQFQVHNKIEGKEQSFLKYSLPLSVLASLIINIYQNGKLVTTDESTMTHHQNLYYGSLLICCMFCGFRQMYYNMFPSLWYHNRVFHLPKHIPQSPAITDLFTVFIVLPYLECHTIVLIQYIAFSYWLLSLSNMHL